MKVDELTISVANANELDNKNPDIIIRWTAFQSVDSSQGDLSVVMIRTITVDPTAFSAERLATKKPHEGEQIIRLDCRHFPCEVRRY